MKYTPVKVPRACPVCGKTMPSHRDYTCSEECAISILVDTSTVWPLVFNVPIGKA